ncbi:MAG: DUF4157 domain-containing protein [Ilumatobacteraceae bacterium]
MQPKLQVGRADDQAEREADRIAGHVVRSLSGATVAHHETAGSDHLGGLDVDAGIEDRINRQRSRGSALDRSTRAAMEPAFGHDFSAVRVHADGQSDALNRSLSARAFTTGNDVFFSAGSYAPDTESGSRLLAHELTHVVQQGGDVQRSVIRRAFDPKNPNSASVTGARELGGGSKNKGVFLLTGEGGRTIIAKFIDEDPRRAQMADVALSATSLTSSGAEPYGAPMVAEMVAAIRRTAAGMRRDDPAQAARLEAAADKAERLSTGVVLMKAMGGEDLGTVLDGNRTSTITEAANGRTPEARAVAQKAIDKAGASGVDPVALLSNPRFHYNLGSLYAADGLLGSVDRFAHDRTGKYSTFNHTNFRVLADGTINTIDSDVVAMGYQFMQGNNAVKDKSANNWTKLLIEGFGIHDMGMAAPGHETQNLTTLFDVACRRDMYDKVVDEFTTLATALDWTGPIVDFATFDRGFLSGIVMTMTSMLARTDRLVAEAARIGGPDEGDGYVSAEALAVKAQYLRGVLPGYANGGAASVDQKAQALRNAQKLAQEMVDATNLAEFDPTLLPVPARPAELGGTEKFTRAIGRGFGSIGGKTQKSRDSKEAKSLRKNKDQLGMQQTEDAYRKVSALGGAGHRQQHAQFELGLQNATLAIHRRANEFGNIDMQIMAFDTAVADPALRRRYLRPYATRIAKYDATITKFNDVAKGYRDQLGRSGDKPKELQGAVDSLDKQYGDFGAAIDWIERQLSKAGN